MPIARVKPINLPTINLPIIYLDHAATTPLDPRVLAAMLPFLKDSFGNPSSSHRLGEESSNAVERAREVIAKSVGERPEHVIFTSGGTEADNMGLALAKPVQRPVIISAIEHPAIRDSAGELKKKGWDVKEAPVSSEGIVSMGNIREFLSRNVLAAVMHVNNEIGTIQPIRAVADLVHDKNGLVLVDCVQSFLKMRVSLDVLGADAVSLSAHKVYGPKGVGCLVTNGSQKPEKVLFGGDQEFDTRPGTPSVANIVGFAKAVESGFPIDEDQVGRIQSLRDRLIKELLESIPKSSLNGSQTLRVCNNVNIAFPGIEGRALIEWLSNRDVCASLGSACSSASLDPSHVLKAIGLSAEQALGSLRFTLGRGTTKEEIAIALQYIREGVNQFRRN